MVSLRVIVTFSLLTTLTEALTLALDWVFCVFHMFHSHRSFPSLGRGEARWLHKQLYHQMPLNRGFKMLLVQDTQVTFFNSGVTEYFSTLYDCKDLNSLCTSSSSDFNVYHRLVQETKQKTLETSGTPSLDMNFRHSVWWPDRDMLETGMASGCKWIIRGQQ